MRSRRPSGPGWPSTRRPTSGRASRPSSCSGTPASTGAGTGPWPLLRAGASDVLAWDASATPAEDVVRRLRRWAAVDRLVASPLATDNLVGAGAAWQLLLREIVEMAAFGDASVLITGESGTGKELVARLVHALDPRRGDEQLVLLDCTTIVPSLAGSEFFGHEKGVFTGALASRDGAFALADRGTLFLDEVGELTPDLQAELLRVVQEGTYKRVGSNDWRTTGFRLVCATNRELRTEEGERRFRSDLYHRIAAWTCRLPSLRERTEDILPLARHFLREAGRSDGSPAAEDFDPAVQRLLTERHYPGSIRELRQLVGRMARRHVGTGPISAGDVPAEERPGERREDPPVPPRAVRPGSGTTPAPGRAPERAPPARQGHGHGNDPVAEPAAGAPHSGQDTGAGSSSRAGFSVSSSATRASRSRAGSWRREAKATSAGEVCRAMAGVGANSIPAVIRLSSPSHGSRAPRAPAIPPSAGAEDVSNGPVRGGRRRPPRTASVTSGTGPGRRSCRCRSGRTPADCPCPARRPRASRWRRSARHP